MTREKEEKKPLALYILYDKLMNYLLEGYLVYSNSYAS